MPRPPGLPWERLPQQAKIQLIREKFGVAPGEAPGLWHRCGIYTTRAEYIQQLRLAVLSAPGEKHVSPISQGDSFLILWREARGEYQV